MSYKKTNRFKLGTGRFREKYDDLLKSSGKKKTLLITGGAGFLGYHLSQRLRNKYNLVFLDIANYPVDEYPRDSKLYDTDVRDIVGLHKVFKENDIDGVVHCAAALPLWSKEDIFTTNIQGTRNVIDVAKEYGVDRFTYISSTAVYGVPDVHPLYEDFPMYGVGNYGISKVEAERMVQEYMSNGIDVSVIRPKTFVGTARLGVFQILYDWVQSGKNIPVIGNGKNKYQLLEVDDLVSAIDLTMNRPKSKVNDIFNIGAKKFDTVDHDVGVLCSHAGTGAKVLHTPSFLVKPTLATLEAMNLSPLYKWVYGTADKDSFVSIEKAEKKLGWKPKYSNSDALVRSYDWYIDHINEITEASGVTHRIRWKQGALGLVKKFM